MTKLHAGGKFDNAAYKVSGGLHGVGVSAVNAVSAWLDMTIERDGAVHKQRYERGEPASALAVAGETESTGTTIRFRPDLTIFSDIVEFDFDILDTRFRETAFLNAGLHIQLTDERGEEPHTVDHHYEGGIKQFVQRLNDRRQVLHDEVIHISGEREIELGEVSVDLAMQWSDAFSEQIQCYTNIIRNRDGGTHLTGLRGALTKSVNAYAKSRNLLKNLTGLSGEDVREGLSAIVSIKHPDPSFRLKPRTNSSAAK